MVSGGLIRADLRAQIRGAQHQAREGIGRGRASEIVLAAPSSAASDSRGDARG